MLIFALVLGFLSEGILHNMKKLLQLQLEHALHIV